MDDALNFPTAAWTPYSFGRLRFFRLWAGHQLRWTATAAHLLAIEGQAIAAVSGEAIDVLASTAG